MIEPRVKRYLWGAAQDTDNACVKCSDGGVDERGMRLG